MRRCWWNARLRSSAAPEVSRDDEPRHAHYAAPQLHDRGFRPHERSSGSRKHAGSGPIVVREGMWSLAGGAAAVISLSDRLCVAILCAVVAILLVVLWLIGGLAAAAAPDTASYFMPLQDDNLWGEMRHPLYGLLASWLGGSASAPGHVALIQALLHAAAALALLPARERAALAASAPCALVLRRYSRSRASITYACYCRNRRLSRRLFLLLPACWRRQIRCSHTACCFCRSLSRRRFPICCGRASCRQSSPCRRCGTCWRCGTDKPAAPRARFCYSV